jgi:hypothetical protein
MNNGYFNIKIDKEYHCWCCCLQGEIEETMSEDGIFYKQYAEYLNGEAVYIKKLLSDEDYSRSRRSQHRVR